MLSEDPTWSEYGDNAIAEPGAGTIDFASVLDAIHEVGVGHTFIEIDDAGDPLAAVESGNRYLRRLRRC